MNSQVLIVLPDDNLGGAEQYLKMISEYYCEYGYNIDVYFLKEKKTNSWEHLKSKSFALYYTSYNRERFGLIALLMRFLKIEKEYKYIYTSHAHVNSFIALLRRLNIIKGDFHIARESSSTFQRYSGLELYLYKLYYQISYKKIDLLICQTELMYNQLLAGMPQLFKKINVKVIPNPIDLNVKNNNSDSVVYNNYIVSAGRLIFEKGFDVLIKSFSLLKDDFENLKLVILGEGKLRGELESLIYELNLEKDVYLHGFVQHVYPFFEKANVCVVSSRIEGFPNVLLQMMLKNNKVVSTKCAGGIEDIKGLIIAEVDDVSSLYIAINKSLKQKDTLLNRDAFNFELEQRSIKSFINKVQSYI